MTDSIGANDQLKIIAASLAELAANRDALATYINTLVPMWTTQDQAIKAAQDAVSALGQLINPPAPLPVSTLPIGSRGIDVSHYQGAIDWGKVKAAGIQFAYIKATEAINIVDSTFKQNWQGAKAAGVLRGAYHFYRFANDPIAQADYFLQQLNGDIGELSPALDAEDMSVKPRGDDMRRFCEHIMQSIGRAPIIYTGRWWWNDPRYLADRQAWAGAYRLWLAAYVPQATVNQYIPPDWSAISLWQSGQGTVNGITGAVDLDMVMA